MTSHALEPVSNELIPYPSAPTTLFVNPEPGAIVRQAAAIAKELQRVIRDQELFTRISGRDHVRVEGWCLLGTMLGVFPVPVSAEPLPDGSGWRARVEARTMTGAVVGSAIAICTRDERNWKDRDEYALCSMAQTRATGKALRLPLGFVMTLAGYDATPAEEMDGVMAAVDAREQARSRTAQRPQSASLRTTPRVARVRDAVDVVASTEAVTLPHPAAEATGETYHGDVLWRVGGVVCIAREAAKGGRYLQSTQQCPEHDSPYFLAPDGPANAWAHGKGDERCVLNLTVEDDVSADELPIEDRGANPAERPGPKANAKQVTAIYEAGGARGYDAPETDRLCALRHKGRGVGELTSREASEFLSVLREG